MNKELASTEEINLVARAVNGDRKSFENLVASNQGLIISIAYNFINRGLPFEDLIQEGNLGLIKAITKYDSTKGCKLSTYATIWIKAYIKFALSKEHENSPEEEKLINKIKYYKEKYYSINGKNINNNDLASLLDITPEFLKSLIKKSQIYISLDLPLFDDNSQTLVDVIADEGCGLDEDLDKKSLKSEVDNIIEGRLSEEECYIIKARMGYFGRTLSLGEISKKLKKPNAVVINIFKKALIKLRYTPEMKSLKFGLK